MEKKVLISVDGSQAADRAVDYVGLMQGDMIKDLKVTLFHVMNPVPAFLRRDSQRDPAAFKRVRELETKNRQAAKQVMDRALERLIKLGLSEADIQLKPTPRAADPARDILFEAEHGMYDAVVLGRRGLSKAQELFVGSVTNKVVQHAERLPIWVVGGQVTSQKVLAAVDGSEGALRAVDHLSFMLGDSPESHITLFHVGASLGNYCTLDFIDNELAKGIEEDLMHAETQCMDDFYARAHKILIDAGFAPEQIETKTREGSLGVSGAVLDEMRKGDYGTVVLGRRGENRSFFLGHVSDKVVARGSEAAIWVVG